MPEALFKGQLQCVVIAVHSGINLSDRSVILIHAHTVSPGDRGIQLQQAALLVTRAIEPVRAIAHIGDTQQPVRFERVLDRQVPG